MGKIMQNQTKVILTFACALIGAAFMWLLAVTGWNDWSSQTTSSYVLSIVVCVLCGAEWGYLYTRGKSSTVQLCAMCGAALAMLILSRGIEILGVKEWIAIGPSWHAAVTGFATFGFASSIYFWCPPKSR